MALNLGRTLPFNDGAQDSLLKSVNAASLKFKHTGKVDENAINQILSAIIESYNSNNQYQLELTSKNNDAIVDKIKSIIVSSQNENIQQIQDIQEYVNQLVEQQNTSSKNIQDILKQDFNVSNSENNSSDNESIEILKNDISNINGMLKNLQGSLWSKLSILDKIDGAIQIFSNGFSKSLETLKATFSKLNPVTAIKNLTGNLTKKISDIAGKLNPVNAIKNLGKSLINSVGSLASKLNPLKLFKRKKKPTKEELKLSKMIDKVNAFIDNFSAKMGEYADKFLNTFLSKSKKIVDKLMTHVLAWLLVNVVLLGVIFAIILKIIAKPLMEILQPIMDFIDSIVGKILEFVAPIRDFLLKNLQKIIDDVIIPLGKFVLYALKTIFDSFIKPFFEGIGNIAKKLGEAIGRLILAITDFTITVLLPFLEKHLIPVLEVILDILKTFFKALEPHIKPFVDVVVTALIEVMATIKELFIILKPVILALGQFLAGLFMDILKGVDWVYKNIVKPIVSGIGKFLSFLANAGKILWMKIKAALPKWAGGEDMNKQREEALKEVARLKNEIAKGYIKNDEEGWDNVKALKEMNEKLKFLNAETGNDQVDVTQDVDQLKTTAEEISQIPEATVKDLAENVNVINDMYKIVQKIYAHITGDTTNLDKIEVEKVPEVKLEIPEEQNIKTEKHSQDEFLIKYFDPFIKYMVDFSNASRQNFELIIEKLNEKPNIVPLPLLDNGVNPATLENM